MLRFRLHSLSVPDWFALSSSFILRFAFTKCSTQIIKSLLANSLRASGVAKQLISSPRAAHPRGAFDLFPVTSKSLLLKSSRLPNFLINYAFFCGNTLRSTSHRDPVMQTEEYVPQRIPAISGSANSRMDATPRMNSTATITKVVREV